MTDSVFTIVVIGACNAGKSSIINSVTKTNACPVSNDGKPMTPNPKFIQSGNKIYIDTPGLPKSSSKISLLKFSGAEQPSMVWLIVNFAAAIESDEFHILNELRDVPVLVVLNKVDFCTNDDVENFDKGNFSPKHRKLASVHKRLIEEKMAHRNIHHIFVTSIKDECDTQRPPIGLDLLKLITDKYITQDQSADARSDETSDLSIAIIGSSSSGKSSMINAILSDNQAAKIGSDGALTTKEWTRYRINRVTLWDCPALNKRSDMHQGNTLAVDANVQPDVIWFMLNYKNANLDTAQELCSTLQVNKETPVIVVINKVDYLRRIHNLTPNALMDFSKREPVTELSRLEKLLELRSKVYETWPNFMNLKAVTMASLTSEESDQEDSSTPIGVDVLLDITRHSLDNDNHKRMIDVLKEKNKPYEAIRSHYSQRPNVPSQAINIFQTISRFFNELRDRLNRMFHGYEG